MFEILAKIVELFFKIPKAYQEQHDLNRKREFGQALVTCYFRLLEVTYSAEEILRQLEFFARRFRKHLEVNDNWEYLTWELESHLKKQSLNLIRLGQAMQAISEELRVLSPEISDEIDDLVTGKGNAVSQLSWVLAGGTLPTRVGFVVEHRRARLENVPNRATANEPAPKQLLTTKSKWGEQVHETVVDYLYSGLIYERIANLKKCAVELRKLLCDRFRLEDILWSVDKFRD